jgi:hypothetical protein
VQSYKEVNKLLKTNIHQLSKDPRSTSIWYKEASNVSLYRTLNVCGYSARMFPMINMTITKGQCLVIL